MKSLFPYAKRISDKKYSINHLTENNKEKTGFGREYEEFFYPKEGWR